MFYNIGFYWIFLLLIIPSSAIAHGGGLDSYGCHRDSNAPNYHCHRGDFAGMVFDSKNAGLAYFAGGESGADLSDNASLVYDRDLYGGWIDEDSDCQDTRQEVLIAQALEVETDASGCRVIRGKWLGPYTGKQFSDPSELHIDHVVSLKEAHESGAAGWSARERQRFANDMDNLLAVDAGENMSKGARGPEQWLPDVGKCRFIRKWLDVKQQWSLDIDRAESDAIDDVLSRC